MTNKLPWIELGTRVTTSERIYTDLAEKSWRNHSYLDAIRYRGIAEGLAIASDHHANVVAEYRDQPGPTLPWKQDDLEIRLAWGSIGEPYIELTNDGCSIASYVAGEDEDKLAELIDVLSAGLQRLRTERGEVGDGR